MFDMINKLTELKQKMDEAKAKLDTILVQGSAGDGAVTVELTPIKCLKKLTLKTPCACPSAKKN